jgi:ABC-type molybdate transport system permease subunit
VGELTTGDSRYRLSFSVGGLFVNEAVVALPLFVESRDWRAVRTAIDADNLLQARTVATARRLA